MTLCVLIPYFKILTLVTAFVLIFIGSTKYIFFAYSWIILRPLLNAEYFGYFSQIDTFIRMISTVVCFFGIYFKYKGLSRRSKLFKYNTIFCGCVFIINVININNEFLFLSLLKITLFYFGSSFSILIFEISKNKLALIRWMVAIFANIIILSIITLLLNHNLAYSYGKDHLFTGIFIHPNKFGMHLIPFLLIFLQCLLFNKSKDNIIYFLFALLIVWIIFMGGSRGSIVALFLSLVITLFFTVSNKTFINQFRFIVRKSYFHF